MSGNTRDSKDFMWLAYFEMGAARGLPLHLRLREAIVRGVLERRLALGAPLPSTRRLADLLQVSRNTVVSAYDQLVQDGFLLSLRRQGHVVNPRFDLNVSSVQETPERTDGAATDWAQRILRHPSTASAIVRPSDWRDYPYPFVYGQIDRTLFPAQDWREAVLATCGVRTASHWIDDRGDVDDPEFIDQIRSRILPRRGVWVPENHILVTLGAQHALFLIAYVLLAKGVVAGVEEPGYPDLRNILTVNQAEITAFEMDAAGLQPGLDLKRCDYLFVAPSHQNPTTVTMTLDRREELLARASRDDVAIIEDDYDSELTFEGSATPAIKGLDRHGRVIYIGSMSKTLAPGVRVGFIVASPEIIQAARAARQLMMRHPPTNNQRAIAHFLSLGHHDRYLGRLVRAFRERVDTAAGSLRRHLPEASFQRPTGGSSLWVKAPEGCDMTAVEAVARARGILFDPGSRFFASRDAPRNYFRLGLSAIETTAIEPGIKALADVIRSQR